MQEQNRHGEAAEARSHSAERPVARSNPREQLARARTMVRRALSYSKGAVLVFLLGAAVTVAVVRQVQHVYRSEATVFAKPRMRTDDRDDGNSDQGGAHQAARLKDMLTTRARLETTIKKFGLYPDIVANKTMLDAVEQMKPHVGFRALEGAQYVVSFDGDQPDTVQKVTQYLAESLIEDYAAGDLGDLGREADFLSGEEERSLGGLEQATRALTVFLAAHPEFAVEAKQAATPFGPSPAAGIPLMPTRATKETPIPVTADPELAALYRERARLEGETKNASRVSPSVVAANASSAKQIDEQIAQAQADVESSAKRVAEAQGDLASKSNLTEDHPDMRAARFAADAAARRLHEAKVKLAGLEQLKAGAAPPPADPSWVPPEIAEKLRQVDGQIAARQVQVAKSQTQPGDSKGAPAVAPLPAPAAGIVELETEWQRMLRMLNEAKSHHDDLKLRYERATLALEAAKSQASERMAIVDPPFRPTHPVKGGRSTYAIAGLGLSLLLALAYAAGRVALDDTLADADDVDALGLLPVLVVVPELGRSPKKVRGRGKEIGADAA